MPGYRKFVALCIVACAFVALKLIYRSLSAEQLEIMLRPVAEFTGFVTGSTVVNTGDRGFLLPGIDILIDRSCSGFNFMTICFVLLSLQAIRHFKKLSLMLLSIPAALTLAYILMMIANTSRVLISVMVQHQLDGILQPGPHYKAHHATGVFTYLFFLITIFLVSEFITKKSKLYETPA